MRVGEEVKSDPLSPFNSNYKNTTFMKTRKVVIEPSFLFDL